MRNCAAPFTTARHVAKAGLGLSSVQRGHESDWLVTVAVEVPRKVAQNQRKGIQNLHKVSNLDAHPKNRVFADSLKRWDTRETGQVPLPGFLLIGRMPPLN